MSFPASSRRCLQRIFLPLAASHPRNPKRTSTATASGVSCARATGMSLPHWLK